MVTGGSLQGQNGGFPPPTELLMEAEAHKPIKTPAARPASRGRLHRCSRSVRTKVSVAARRSPASSGMNCSAQRI